MYFTVAKLFFSLGQRSGLSLHLHLEGKQHPNQSNLVLVHFVAKPVRSQYNYLLQICHTLTEKLVAMTMGSGAKVKAPASLSDIITVAKRISPR